MESGYIRNYIEKEKLGSELTMIKHIPHPTAAPAAAPAAAPVPAGIQNQTKQIGAKIPMSQEPPPEGV